MAACNVVGGAELRRSRVAQTVIGPLDASKLGFTLAHEHVAEGKDILERWPSAWGDRAALVAKTAEKLRAVRAAGVATIVDLTTYDAGRDVRFLAEVSRASGINMIACTGQRFFPPSSKIEMPSHTIEGLCNFFRREIQEGIEDSGVKAGVIKIGIGAARPTALEEIGLRAAARASKMTGFPIRIHAASALRAGENIAVILEDEGVDSARVSFDHSDDSGKIDYFLGLAQRGYSLGMDHVHRGLKADFGPSFARRAECIKRLVDSGFANRIFLSQDTELGGYLLPDEAKTWREKVPWDPPEGLLFVTGRLIPHLKSIGISDESIHTITVGHPRDFFGRV